MGILYLMSLPPTLDMFGNISDVMLTKGAARGRRFYIPVIVSKKKKVRAGIGTKTLLEEIMCRDGAYPCSI
jgi:hypothetical protein